MPNSNSAKKRLRQNKVNRGRNRSKKSAMRTEIRKIREAAAEISKTRQELEADGKSGEEVTAAIQEQVNSLETQYRVAQKKLDRAGSTNLIHRNKAARTKSRLQRLIRSVKLGA
ncbi:MAG: 30S ribosomal protein S20 [Planctomycetaceae bacterium]|nr:30S ribosomal protein S20 [Planctomycetaceae bacterium]MEE2990699.1 30S ribosomal protein S20 [Planctomycetota bacterium]